VAEGIRITIALPLVDRAGIPGPADTDLDKVMSAFENVGNRTDSDPMAW
jgi:hypothetical protein